MLENINKQIQMRYQDGVNIHYEDLPEEHAALDEFDEQALELYRLNRSIIKPNAPEIRYSDEDLLKMLHATITIRGATYPTKGGILLFGKPMTLRRLFPLSSQVDLMISTGKDLLDGYTTLEFNESLITAVPKLLDNFMSHIPATFSLKEDHVTRQDNPLIPVTVIREALVNALIHKDYECGSSTRIIKYSNRIEFINAGFSLLNSDDIDQGNSIVRNPHIAKIFQELNYAEVKGIGMQTMHDEMQKANLSIPVIKSSRDSNCFILTLKLPLDEPKR